jgi:hypothetical protein
MSAPAVRPALSPEQALTVYRARCPDALVCTRCAALLATQRGSYRLPEAERRAYVCAECRAEAAEAVRVAQARSEAARANLAVARARRAGRALTQPLIESVVSPSPDPQDSAESHDRVVIPRALPLAAAARKMRNSGGRPRKHDSLVIARREARRAYRARRRAASSPLMPEPA